ncbi:hypothetical protein GC176_12425 [bacterium]|nr:hypothetical protein [bacterium]
MSLLVVHCPKCNKGLKLRDESKLGKKGKCPKCAHVFVMQRSEPAAQDEDEVEFQLATPAPQPQTTQPVAGVAAHWVPDNAPVGTPQQPAPMPGMQPAVFNPNAPQTGFHPDAAPAAVSAPVSIGADLEGGAARLKELKRKSAKRRNFAIVAGLLTSLLVGGGVYAVNDYQAKEKARLAALERPKVDEDARAKHEELKQTSEEAKSSSPTKGEPIAANCLPLGTRMMISLRPAELWKPQSRGEEIRFCLGPFGTWAEEKVKELCRFEPAQIEHALIGILPGPVGQPPQTAVVVKLVADARKSELITAFGGELVESFGYPVYINEAEDRCYLIKDLRTIAIGPAESAEDMARSVEFPNPQSDGIDALLPQTDAERHVTLVFEPRTIDAFLRGQNIFGKDVEALVRQTLTFFNPDDIDCVAWSLHFGDKEFYSDMLLRNTTLLREVQLSDAVRGKVKELPFEILSMVEKMNPQVLGPRKVIGRFPAMTQVFAKSSKIGVGTRFAELTTTLPERAAPNLALGALLAWDESTRTDFNAQQMAPVKTQSTDSNLPELVLDRLKMKIDMEFARAPLQDAFAYIADECKVDHYIDGDALKASGYTKNMPNTFTMNDTGLAGIKAIFDAPQREQLCLVIQQDKKRFLITTLPFAKEQGLTPYKFE